MKLNCMKKSVAAIVAVCVAAMFCVVPVMDPAHADYYPAVKYAKKVNVIYCADLGKYSLDIKMGKKAKNAKTITVTSSNPKVAKPQKCWYEKYATVMIKKPGKTKLTIKVKTKKKTKKYKCTVKVIPYENPIQSFTVGSEDMTSKFDVSPFGEYASDQDIEGVLNITMKNGWKAKKIKYIKESLSSDKATTKTVKNGDMVTLYKTGPDMTTFSELEITVSNASLGVTQTMDLAQVVDMDE